MANNLRAVSIIATLFCFSLPLVTQAETILLPVARQGDYLGDVKRPAKGQTQERIRSQFGEPETIGAAKGNPPISRWDYVDFSVYFESGVVIHSVLKHRRKDELKIDSPD